jgi:hypothetical protein
MAFKIFADTRIEYHRQKIKTAKYFASTISQKLAQKDAEIVF